MPQVAPMIHRKKMPPTFDPRVCLRHRRPQELPTSNQKGRKRKMRKSGSQIATDKSISFGSGTVGAHSCASKMGGEGGN